jgi:peptidoglycan/xylan/chitin deacetylase (PgdA/CDA1 family)
VKNINLLYHDIIDNAENYNSSGFVTGYSNIYKFYQDVFEGHVKKVSQSQGKKYKFTFTFDDGGIGSLLAAVILEKYQMRGVFFITTSLIGKKGFLSSEDIQSLANRGHIIGSHTHTHPMIMSDCLEDELLREWNESCKILSLIINNNIIYASISGGSYSDVVAEMAHKVNIKKLYTSEPQSKIKERHGMEVIGRYSIHRTLSDIEIFSILKGSKAFRIKQYLYWNIKKIAKKLFLSLYKRVRSVILTRKVK